MKRREAILGGGEKNGSATRHRRTLKFRIALASGVLLGVLGIGVITPFHQQSRRLAEMRRLEAISSSKEILLYAGDSGAESFRRALEAPLDTARTIAQVLSTHAENGIFSRSEVNGILVGLLEANRGFLGICTAWEPDAFDERDSHYAGTEGHDGTGRFIPYWSRGNGGIVALEPLQGYEIEGVGDYYLLPRRSNSERILNPYTYPIQGVDVPMTSLVAPISRGGDFVGIVGVDLKLDGFQGMVDRLSAELYNGRASVSLISHNGTIVAMSGRPDASGHPLNDYHDGWEAMLARIQAGERSSEEQENNLTVYTPVIAGNTDTPWSLHIEVPIEIVAEKIAVDEKKLNQPSSPSSRYP